MYTNERRNSILELVKQQESVSVDFLSKEFGVSTVTIRSDLKFLQDKNLIIRTHGGATKITKGSPLEAIDTEYQVRKTKNIGEKETIAKKAAQYIHEGDCIILDASTTCYEFAKELVKLPIRMTVLTSGLRTANLLKDSTYLTVIVIGGIVKTNSNVIESTLGMGILNNFNIDTFFTSSYAISIEDGLSDFSLYESDSKREFVNHADKTIALVDHTKFEKKSIVRFCSVDQISLVISDNQLAPKTVQAYQKYTKIV